ncbi:TetR/AcrR family transcriptional regulator C-terminal domain-containing protein [Streptosporangium sandarakinum]|uniref:AcrR family transcriptional regulator n=1 Tax=Streptosporangium sandarakinum TaxID=1260955 RepID=A0A852UZH9_9ACTN|nr:TetR/AcrR family transcriptional regulator C-terminal domain-containing protein [Streptosporangium sandarakinum]NYF40434.1 AcrR family transcriptional regulator [Streptosporangium sandarakinum]
MPRPRSLTPTTLATAALAVIDRDGLAGLTMRTVAKEVGMSTMGLYRYVTDRAELERLVVDLVLSQVDTAPPDPAAPWTDRVAAMVRRLRGAVGTHPSVIPLIVAHRHRSERLLGWSETLVGILKEAGLDGPRRVVALRCLLAYVIGALQLDHLGPLAGPGTSVIADLPEFPLMAETAREARGVGVGAEAEAEFDDGLAAILRGMECGHRP